MRKIFSTTILTLATTLFFSACFNDNDDDTVYSSDCNISSFSLGTIYRELHTIGHDGSDSLYYGVYTGSYYAMHIDQRNGMIYNTDSLLYNSDASRIMATVSYSGSAAYRVKDDPEAEWRAYSSDDSINFTRPLEFRIFAEDGVSSRSYTVTLNVHQQESEEFNWSKLGANDELQQLTNKRMLVVDDLFVLYGTAGTALVRAESAIDNGLTWQIITISGCDDANPKSVQYFKQSYYMTNAMGTLYSSVDGISWSKQSEGAIDQLLAANDYELYAMKEGKLLASKDALTWYDESLDEHPNLLPTEHLAAISYPLKTNSKLDRVLLIGSRSVADYPSETHAMVWGKLYDTTSRNNNIWSFYDVSSDNRTPCPRLKDLSIIRYDEKMIAFGGENLVEGSENEALDAFYVSRDNGITWIKSDYMSPPETLKATTEEFVAAVDSKHFIWIICGNEIWRGRLNRLGFESNNGAFTE